jgi:hypothetical protein
MFIPVTILCRFIKERFNFHSSQPSRDSRGEGDLLDVDQLCPEWDRRVTLK